MKILVERKRVFLDFYVLELTTMDRYEILKNLGSGNFGVAKLVRDKWTGELHAVKYIERGKKVRI